jgi:hypothetical protein
MTNAMRAWWRRAEVGQVALGILTGMLSTFGFLIVLAGACYILFLVSVGLYWSW